jgi:hypothetical protein
MLPEDYAGMQVQQKSRKSAQSKKWLTASRTISAKMIDVHRSFPLNVMVKFYSLCSRILLTRPQYKPQRLPYHCISLREPATPPFLGSIVVLIELDCVICDLKSYFQRLILSLGDRAISRLLEKALWVAREDHNTPKAVVFLLIFKAVLMNEYKEYVGVLSPK